MYGGDGMKLDMFDWLAIILVIIGALNWGLVGLFNFNIAVYLSGGGAGMLSRIVYAVIGLAGGYMIYLMVRLKKS